MLGVRAISPIFLANCKASTSSYTLNGKIGTRFLNIAASSRGINPAYSDSNATSQPAGHSDADPFGRAYGTGRRKTSVARVWIRPGSGMFTVNYQRFSDYFQPVQREHALGSFLASHTAGMFDVWCTVKGGGISGQAGAIRLGISRALAIFDPQLRPELSKAGMLTRDSRRVERKKPGQKKARKKFQWVKR